MAKQTFTQAKAKIQELEMELAQAKQRVGKKDFYQGMAWGAGAVAVIAILIKLFM